MQTILLILLTKEAIYILQEHHIQIFDGVPLFFLLNSSTF